VTGAFDGVRSDPGGRYVRASASRSTAPAWTSRSTPAAVTTFEIDATWNGVSGLAPTPAAAAQTGSPSTTMAAASERFRGSPP